MAAKSLDVLALAAAILLTSAPARGQESGAQEGIQLRGQEVLLDLVVTDKKGRPVLDLKPGEIEVYENGERQEITSFSLIRSGLAPGDGPAAERAPEGGLPAPLGASLFRGYNFILIVVDQASIQAPNMNSLYTAAERFIRERLAPNDLVAVFTAGSRLAMLQNFTNNRARLLEAMRRATRSVQGSSAAAPAADSAATRAQILDAGVDYAGLTTKPESSQAEIAPRLAQLLNEFARGIDPVSSGLREQFQSVAILSDLLTLTKVYSNVPGRKSVLLYSEGFTVNEEVEHALKAVVSASNRNNFAFYTIDAAGLRADSGPATAGVRATRPAEERDSRMLVQGGRSGLDQLLESSLRSSVSTGLSRLAADTGGVALRNSNDLGRGFEAIQNDLHSYYTLSYAPKDTKLDGKFRAIEVKAVRKNIELRARKGYFAVPGGSDGILFPYEQPILAMLEAATAAARPSDLPVTVRTERFRAEGGWLVPIVMAIDAASLTPAAQPARDKKAQPAASAPLHFEVDSLALVFDTSGTVVAKLSRPLLYRVSKDELHEFRKQVLTVSPFAQRLVLKPGNYRLKLGVYDPASRKGSVVEQAIKLPELPADAAPTLSSLVLSRGALPLHDGERATAAADPLVFGGKVRILPNATGRFAKSRRDNLVVFFRLYGAPNTQYEAQMRFVRDNKVVNTTPVMRLPVMDGRGEAEFAPTIPLDTFEPGTYRIFLYVSEPGSATPLATGTAVFQVDA